MNIAHPNFSQIREDARERSEQINADSLSELELVTMAAKMNGETVREQQQEIARLRGILGGIASCSHLRLCDLCKSHLQEFEVKP